MTKHYCTTSELKEILPDVNWSSDHDAALESLLSKASRAIDLAVKKWPGYFAAEASTYYFNGSGLTEQWVSELAEVPTEVAVAEAGIVDGSDGTGGDYTVWASNTYFCWPYNALNENKPFRRLDINLQLGLKYYWHPGIRTVKITAPFGWSTEARLPEDIKLITAIQAMRWYKRGQQAFQDAGAIAELSQIRYVKDLDPDLKVILQNYVEFTV